jgi:DUF4097 and DUF4098 domain-containing protein YvlB
MAAMLAGLASAQDFHKAYAIPAGGQISVKNVSGDIKVTGYSGGNSVLVDAYRVGRDRDLVEIEDSSTGGRVELHVRYPQSCNCDASVNFEVRVPANVDYAFDGIGSVSGGVELSGVQGNIRAESVSGGVVLTDVGGTIKASSVSGSVNAQVTRIDKPGELRFSSVSGSVAVIAPARLNADIDMSSVSGSLQTDFPIEVQKEQYGPGQHARGRLGSGTTTLRISTVSGKVTLTRM